MNAHITTTNGVQLHWHTLHRALWNWLAKSGESDKGDWPGWEGMGGNIPDDIPCSCFACHYTSHDGHAYGCEDCPLEWPPNKYDQPRCICRGLYDWWEDATNAEERCDYAARIRDLPVKGE